MDPSTIGGPTLAIDEQPLGDPLAPRGRDSGAETEKDASTPQTPSRSSFVLNHNISLPLSTVAEVPIKKLSHAGGGVADRNEHSVSLSHGRSRGEGAVGVEDDDDDHICCKTCINPGLPSKKTCICLVPIRDRRVDIEDRGCRNCGCKGCGRNAKIRDRSRDGEKLERRDPEEERERRRRREGEKIKDSRDEPSTDNPDDENEREITKTLGIFSNSVAPPEFYGFKIPERSFTYIFGRPPHQNFTQQ